uniref:glutathione gamma-glutamylcysteinyltransferase n=1 Tax=Ceratophyllum demersum TaxID=4428 RepID=E5GCW5_CERDE|nr:phytochelatin synthase [Ceratophyllum demersum]
MAIAGLYKRVLPCPPAVEFSSGEGRQLFCEALKDGTMEGFFKLISYFQTQSEPAYCGLASISVVLNALSIDPGRTWKGPWRWFDESMLDCCESLEKVKAKGITFGKVVCLARCSGAKVEAFLTNQSTTNDFRKHVITCASSDDCHLIASYHRSILKQTGTGHFSPIGGYHAGRDMVLILDVARFKYPPHWVPLPLLWEAMDTVDIVTGHPRGFMLISKLQVPSLLYTLSCKHTDWINSAKFLVDDLPKLLNSKDINSIEDILSILCTSLNSNVLDFIKWVAEVRRSESGISSLSIEEKGRLSAKEDVLRTARETELFKYVTEWLYSSNSCYKNFSNAGSTSLSIIGTNVCCQGAELLSGRLGNGCRFCCSEICIKYVKDDIDYPKTIVSGSVQLDGNNDEVDALIPTSPVYSKCGPSGTNDCSEMCPGDSDILTMLLLTLPPHTWCAIENEKLLTKVQALVSTESLPMLLQEEVLHLRNQLNLLVRFQKNKEDDDYLRPTT